MKQKMISINNSEIYYAVEGKGKPVVLVHGFAENSDVWKYQLNELAKHYQLIIPDLPGSGNSAPIEDMSIEGLAESVKKIIDAEALNDVVMIGHSMGGYITLAFAEKYPGLLKAFGLFHSTAFADTEEKKATRRKAIAFMQSHGSYEFINQSTPNLFTEAFRIKNELVLEEMINRYSSFDPLVLIAYYEAMIKRPDRTAVLQSFNKPILLLIGRQDKAILFEDIIKQSHLPEIVSIEILEHSAHMGMWEEKEKSNQALLSFLKMCNS